MITTFLNVSLLENCSSTTAATNCSAAKGQGLEGRELKNGQISPQHKVYFQLLFHNLTYMNAQKAIENKEAFTNFTRVSVAVY